VTDFTTIFEYAKVGKGAGKNLSPNLLQSDGFVDVTAIKNIAPAK